MQDQRSISIKANNAVVALVDLFATIVNELQAQNAAQQTIIKTLTARLTERSEDSHDQGNNQ